MSSTSRKAYWALSFILWVYIILRAVYSPFVYDEATTFLLYVHNNNFVPGYAFWSANNHFLNSALTWMSYHALGIEEWKLRLPNLLAFPFFAFYLIRIAAFLKTDLSQKLLIFGVFSGHIFIEMFGYSRGYGLSFAFLVGAVFYLLCIFKQGDIKYFVGFYLSNALILAANLTLLPLSMFFAFSLLVWAISKGKFKSVLRIELLTGAPIIAAIYISLKLKAEGKLYYASLDGLNGTLNSLFDAFFGNTSWLWQAWLAAILVFLTIFTALYFKHKTYHSNKTVLFLIGLLLAPWLFFFFGNIVLSVNQPLDRAVLYMPFLLFLALAFLLDSVAVKNSTKYKVSLLAVLPFVVHFAFSANLNKATAFLWNTEQIPDKFYETIKNNNTNLPLVSGYFLRQKCWEYLNIKSDKKTNVLQIADYPSAIADYQIVNLSETGKLDLYATILHDANSGLSLLQRKEKLKKELVLTQKIKPVSNKKGFTEFAKINLDTLNGALVIEYRLQLKSSATPFRGLLGFTVIDSAQQNVHYEELRLRNLYDNLYSGQEIHQKLYLSEIPENGKKLTVFLWNLDDQNFEIESGTIEIYQLTRTP